MDIKQLRYFIGTAKYLNFTEAAKHLFIAQPALSRQIAHLEDYLDVQLFIRDKRGLQLTVAGAELLTEAHAIVAKLEEAVRKAKLAASGVMGSLKIGYLGTSEKKFLPKLIRTFCKENRNIGLSVSRSNWATLSDALDTGELDVAFTLTFGIENTPDLRWETVYTEFLALVVSDDHPLANERKVNINDLAKESFVMMARGESPQLFDYILKLCANGGFYPDIVSQPQLFETVLLQVEAGLGITILSRHAKDYASPSLRFIDIDHNNASVNLVMVWKASNTNPCILLFLSELKKSMGTSKQGYTADCEKQ